MVSTEKIITSVIFIPLLWNLRLVSSEIPTGAFCKTCIPLLLFKVLTWLGYFNSAMNPVIYSIFNTEFRDAFQRILITYVRNECCESHRDDRRPSRNSNPDHHHHYHQASGVERKFTLRAPGAKGFLIQETIEEKSRSFSMDVITTKKNDPVMTPSPVGRGSRSNSTKEPFLVQSSSTLQTGTDQTNGHQEKRSSTSTSTTNKPFNSVDLNSTAHGNTSQGKISAI